MCCAVQMGRAMMLGMFSGLLESITQFVSQPPPAWAGDVQTSYWCLSFSVSKLTVHSLSHGIIHCLTSRKYTYVPPVFQTCPPKTLLNICRFIISLNFWTLAQMLNVLSLLVSTHTQWVCCKRCWHLSRLCQQHVLCKTNDNNSRSVHCLCMLPQTVNHQLEIALTSIVSWNQSSGPILLEIHRYTVQESVARLQMPTSAVEYEQPRYHSWPPRRHTNFTDRQWRWPFCQFRQWIHWWRC